VLKKKLRTTP